MKQYSRVKILLFEMKFLSFLNWIKFREILWIWRTRRWGKSRHTGSSSSSVGSAMNGHVVLRYNFLKQHVLGWWFQLEMIKKVHSYSIVDIPKLEAWLKEESKKGLRLVKVSGSTFFFRECEPKEREYFFYQSPGTDRHGSFWGSFAACQRQYGLRKSELNRQLGPCFEVDPLGYVYILKILLIIYLFGCAGS